MIPHPILDDGTEGRIVNGIADMIISHIGIQKGASRIGFPEFLRISLMISS
jgi:hypothetical protein